MVNYYASNALFDVEINYSEIEKLAIALVIEAKTLRHTSKLT